MWDGHAIAQQLDFLISPLLQQSAFSKYSTVGKYHKGLVNNSDLHPLKLLFIHTYYTNTKLFVSKLKRDFLMNHVYKETMI